MCLTNKVKFSKKFYKNYKHMCLINWSLWYDPSLPITLAGDAFAFMAMAQ